MELLRKKGKEDRMRELLFELAVPPTFKHAKAIAIHSKSFSGQLGAIVMHRILGSHLIH